MSFWNGQTAEPLRQYRWYITFGSQGEGGIDSIRYALKKVDKPKAKIGSVQHKYMNHFFNYPGRLEWEDINITFAAVTQPSATYIINNVLGKAGYFFPTKPTEGQTIGKKKFNNAIGNFDIHQVNPDGTELEKWTIINPFFTSVQFGALDYSNEEIVEISCTVKYDSAQLTAQLNAGNDSST